jgi:ferritin-like metal-binding protein YciE
MQISNLQDLFVHELKDMYSAEQQIIRNGPAVAKKCQSDELREAVEQHIRETEEQAKRLEQVLMKFGEKATGITCKGM